MGILHERYGITYVNIFFFAKYIQRQIFLCQIYPKANMSLSNISKSNTDLPRLAYMTWQWPLISGLMLWDARPQYYFRLWVLSWVHELPHRRHQIINYNHAMLNISRALVNRIGCNIIHNVYPSNIYGHTWRHPDIFVHLCNGYNFPARMLTSSNGSLFRVTGDLRSHRTRYDVTITKTMTEEYTFSIFLVFVL